MVSKQIRDRIVQAQRDKERKAAETHSKETENQQDGSGSDISGQKGHSGQHHLGVVQGNASQQSLQNQQGTMQSQQSGQWQGVCSETRNCPISRAIYFVLFF